MITQHFQRAPHVGPTFNFRLVDFHHAAGIRPRGLGTFGRRSAAGKVWRRGAIFNWNHSGLRGIGHIASSGLQEIDLLLKTENFSKENWASYAPSRRGFGCLTFPKSLAKAARWSDP